MRARSLFAAAFACALTAVAPASATAGTLDQQQTTVSSYAQISGSGKAQTFTPQRSGGLDQVDLSLARFDISGPLMTVEIRDVVSGGAPGATVLASASVPDAAISSNFTYVSVQFASPAPVLAGTQYAIVAYAGSPFTSVYGWGGAAGDPYAGGVLFASPALTPTSWVPFPDQDVAFKTYVTTSYDFSGFFSPVDNPPVVNLAKAGSSVPVKFSLGGDHGLGVLVVDYPQLQLYNCDGGLIDPIEETTTANSGLSYDPFTGAYTYVWKTDKAWRGKCGTLTVMLDDASTHTAEFQFK